MEDIINKIFNNKFNVKLYNDACYLEFKHNEDLATFALSLISYPGSLKIQGVSVKKRFNDVESILQPILDKFKIDIGFWKSTIFQDFQYESDEFDLNNRTGLEKVFGELKPMVASFERDFLDLYASLNQVYEMTEKMEIKEMVNFISQPLPLRRMVIKRICDDKGFNQYCEGYIESSKKMAKERPVQFRNHDKAAIELYQVLKSL